MKTDYEQLDVLAKAAEALTARKPQFAKEYGDLVKECRALVAGQDRGPGFFVGSERISITPLEEQIPW